MKQKKNKNSKKEKAKVKDEETVPPDGASLTLRPIKRWPTGDDRQFEGNFIAGCLISVSLGRCVMSANRLAELQLGGSSADPHANDIHDGLAGSCISMFAGHRPWPPSNESEKPAPSPQQTAQRVGGGAGGVGAAGSQFKTRVARHRETKASPC